MVEDCGGWMEEKWMDMLEEKESERALFGDDLCACGDEGWM